MAISHVTNEPNICQFQYIYSTNNNVVVKRGLLEVKHGYKMTKREFIRTLLLIFPTTVHLLFKHNLCNFPLKRTCINRDHIKVIEKQ